MRSVSVLLTILLLASFAQADYEETEHRLKTARVDAALRKRIHTAIDRGVEFLLATQIPSGGWSRIREEPATRGYFISDISPLPALALRHAGTPRAMAGFKKSMARLFPKNSRGLESLHDDIYLGGMTCMLLMADRSHPEIAGEIARRIARSWDRHSRWWGYQTTRGRSRYGIPELINLSTTQFAGLGMWAGDRLGAQVDKRFWRGHLKSLCRFQCEDGSWRYAPRRYKTGYHNGTFMGFANLLLAERALKDVLAEDAVFANVVAKAKARGLAKLHQDAAAVIEGLKYSSERWCYYGLYALEKACVFANLERVGDVRWYVDGAAVLCDLQNKDGGWGWSTVPGQSRPDWIPRSNIVDTSFALLFLLRSSEAYRPVTPRPIDTRRGATTPGPGATPEVEPKPKAPPKDPQKIEVEISFAWMLLDRLRSLLVENRAPNPEIESALEMVGTARAGLKPDPGGEKDQEWKKEAARWAETAAGLVLRSVGLARVKAGSKRNLRLPVNLIAIRMLVEFGPRASPPLIAAFEKSIFRAKKYDPDPAIYETGFRTLALLGRREAFLWLAQDVIDADARDYRIGRTRAALKALRGFKKMTGADRYEAFKRVVRLFAPVEGSDADPARLLMDRLNREITDTLRHLSRDPATGKPPVTMGGWVGTIRDFEVWLRKHRDPNRPPWTPAR